MKTLVILMSILLTAFFSLTPAFGQSPENKSDQSMEQDEKPAKWLGQKIKTADANAVADANPIVDVNTTNDPNAVRADIEKFEGLDGDLRRINNESRKEISEWTRGRLDDRLELALAMQEQIKMELEFLRKLAAEEGAAKTTAAINGILLDRQERFVSVIKELERNNARFRRRAEREERRNQERLEREQRHKERLDRGKKDTQN